MQTIPAYAARNSKDPLAPYEIQRRNPGTNDVQIDIKYCGICHSDIHQVRGEWGNSTYPMVPGHEIAGVVSKIGAKVDRFREGDHVGVGCLTDSCGECKDCKAGLENYCVRPVWTYNGTENDGKTPTYGGYSTRIVVDQGFVLRIPDNIPLDAAAPLLCAGITLYSPLRHWNAGAAGKRVGVIGLGGLGHMGVKLAKAMGAEVTVLSHSRKKEEDAKRLGADRFIETGHSETWNVPNSLDLLLNTAPVALDWERYVSLLDRDGTMVLLGVPDATPSVHPFSLIGRRRSLAGSVIGGLAETQEMLDFCGKHDVVSDIELIPIQKLNEAYERTIKGDVRYRFVIDIESLKP